MKWVIRAYTLILLAYTGWRTWDFIQQQLPANATGFWLAIVFLFATEAGLLLWHELSLNHASTYEQQAIATTMTWVDFVASLSAGVADMMLRQTMIADMQVPEWLATGLIYGLPLIMAANVAAALIYMSNDAEHVLARTQRQVMFEARKQAMREIASNRGQLARSVKDEIRRSIAEQVDTETTSHYGRKPERLPEVASTPAPVASTKGHDSKHEREVLADVLANPTQRRKSGNSSQD